MFSSPFRRQRQVLEDTETKIKNLMLSKNITLEEARKIVVSGQRSVKDF